MAIGPLELLMIGCPGKRFASEILPELSAIQEQGLIEVVDLLFGTSFLGGLGMGGLGMGGGGGLIGDLIAGGVGYLAGRNTSQNQPQYQQYPPQYQQATPQYPPPPQYQPPASQYQPAQGQQVAYKMVACLSLISWGNCVNKVS